MHPALENLKEELVQFGLNPSQWLVEKISLQKNGQKMVTFRSTKDSELSLMGQLKRHSNLKLEHLEWVGI